MLPAILRFWKAFGTGCWWLLVLISRTPRAGVGQPVTVSEPRFLLMFPPGVTPTLRGGEAGVACSGPAPARPGGSRLLS